VDFAFAFGLAFAFVARLRVEAVPAVFVRRGLAVLRVAIDPSLEKVIV
jgi:hypothetical protein